MKVGDLIDDGLDNIGIIVELGNPDLDIMTAILVHFPDSTLNGWYEAKDLEPLCK